MQSPQLTLYFCQSILYWQRCWDTLQLCTTSSTACVCIFVPRACLKLPDTMALCPQRTHKAWFSGCFSSRRRQKRWWRWWWEVIVSWGGRRRKKKQLRHPFHFCLRLLTFRGLLQHKGVCTPGWKCSKAEADPPFPSALICWEEHTQRMISTYTTDKQRRSTMEPLKSTWCSCRHCSGCGRGWWRTGRWTPSPSSGACCRRRSRTPWRTPPSARPPRNAARHTASARSSPAAATSPPWTGRWFYLDGDQNTQSVWRQCVDEWEFPQF